MYQLLLDHRDVLEKDEYVGEIRQSIVMKEKISLINMNSIKFIFKQLIGEGSEDVAELVRCYPDPKFVYYFYQLADQKVVKSLRNILYISVKTNLKIHFP